MLIFSLILLRNAMLLGNMFRISWNCKKWQKVLCCSSFVVVAPMTRPQNRVTGHLQDTIYICIYDATSTSYCATPRPEDNIDVASGQARRDVAPYEHASQWSSERTAGARGRVPLTSVKEPLKYRATAGLSLVTPRRSFTFFPLSSV